MAFGHFQSIYPHQNLSSLLFGFFVAVLLSTFITPTFAGNILSYHSSSRHLLDLDYSNWIQGGTRLPRSVNENLACGYDSITNSVWLLGGWTAYSRRQLVSYNITSDSFTDYGEYYFGQDVFGRAQYYTQIGQSLYVIKSNDGTNIQQFNFSSIQLYDFSTIPTAVGGLSCIASTDQDDGYLYVVGGDPAGIINTVQIYNMSSDQWLPSVPSLNTARHSESCIVNNGQLYAIGGDIGNFNYIDTIEVLSVNNLLNIQSESWGFIDGALSTIFGWSRAINYKTNILIIGGFTGGPYPGSINEINVINTITNTVSVQGYLDIALYSTSAITINNIGYSFSGTSAGDTWRFIDLIPTPNPTSAPTNDPTKLPTDSPTSDPTKEPTELPSDSPTDDPTSEPTIEPTELPSDSPTDDPTKQPTAPTTHPVVHPTAPTDNPTAPTKVPTELPTGTPTDDPTKQPTEIPTEVPTDSPTDDPTKEPSEFPTDTPTSDPTKEPTAPTMHPVVHPTASTGNPSIQPTALPTDSPTNDPTIEPTELPTDSPTDEPTVSPTGPTMHPVVHPTASTGNPSIQPTEVPTDSPTEDPTRVPTSAEDTTVDPTEDPTRAPTLAPTLTEMDLVDASYSSKCILMFSVILAIFVF